MSCIRYAAQRLFRNMRKGKQFFHLESCDYSMEIILEIISVSLRSQTGRKSKFFMSLISKLPFPF